MAKTYIQQLKEKADIIFKNTYEENKKYIATLVHKPDGTVEASIDSFSTGFNHWILEIPSKQILKRQFF